MSKEPSSKSGASEVDAERRKFLKSSGAAIASGLAVPFMAGSDSAAAGAEGDENSAAEERVIHAEASKGTWHKPNIIILINDMERFPMHWPEGWADANLPNHKRLAQHGLTFTSAFTAASMCTPSRGTIFTGLYPPEHGAIYTGSGVLNPSLQPSIPNMATMLASAGYDVEYRGKWHLSKNAYGDQQITCGRDLEVFGFQGWQPPEAGLGSACDGGGVDNYDEWYAAGAADFLKSRKSSKPFALVVSLVNPHDISGYPGISTQPEGGMWGAPSLSDQPPYKGTVNYGGVDLDASPLDQIQLPANFAAELYKPACQAESLAMWDVVGGPLSTEEDQLHYARAYAYLHMVVDQHIGTVLDALESRRNLYRNTIIIRLTDHGDVAMSHGGMRQKAYCCYEEMFNIPLQIYNPVLFPKAVQTSALASSVDIMPTVATIAGVPKKDIPTLRGVDLTPIIQDAIKHPASPSATVRDSVFFTFDEMFLTEYFAGFITQPAMIRCLRQKRWKIVMYYDPYGVAASVYELYDLQDDPLEQNNLGNPSNPNYNGAQLAIMQQALQAMIVETHASLLTQSQIPVL